MTTDALPEGWAESTIIVRYPVEELEAARAYYAKSPHHYDPDRFANFASKLSARLGAAALDQISAPQRQPMAGEVWRHKEQGHARPVRAVDDTYVYLGPSSDGRSPFVWTLAGFLDGWELVSEGGQR